MERLGICLFLYRDIKRARNILDSLSCALLDSSETVHVYIDYYNEQTSMIMYDLAARSSVVENIKIRKSRFGLKNQVLSAMRDMSLIDYTYVLFLEDDLLLGSQALPWLRQAIINGGEEIICLYSEFDTPYNKRLRRFSSWGYTLSNNILRQFIEYMDIRSRSGVYHKLWMVGLDAVKMLRSDRSGKISSWAIYFICFQMMSQNKSLHPPSSLVAYCGLDGLGEHTNSNYSWVKRSLDREIQISNRTQENICLDIKYFLVMTTYSIIRKLYGFFR